jgi:hypothetical protein
VSTTPPVWVTDWLAPARYAKYLRAAGGDHRRALALYEWNARLAAALLHDVSHLEVGIRNAYDRALLEHPAIRGGDWLAAEAAQVLFPAHWVHDRVGARRDKNATPRRQVASARRTGGQQAGGSVQRGKVIAELTFGFWSYLTDSLHEKALWVPALHAAYRPGADRAALHVAMTAVRDVRNRLAHHESVFDRRPELARRYIVHLAGSLSPELKDHLASTSTVSEVLAGKPSS